MHKRVAWACLVTSIMIAWAASIEAYPTRSFTLFSSSSHGNIKIAQNIQGVDADHSNWFRYTPSESDANSWFGWASQFTNVDGSRKNHVLRIGSNITGGGGSFDATNPAVAIEFENYYAPDSNRYLEFHIPFVTSGSTVRRALTYQYRFVPSEFLTGAMQLDSFDFQTRTGTVAVSMEPANQLIRLGSASNGIVIDRNNSPAMRQLNAAGNDYVFLPRVDSNNRVELDPGVNGVKVNSFFQLTNAGAKPTCNSSHVGKIWYEAGGAGVTDSVFMCLKAAADTYSWRTIQTGG